MTGIDFAAFKETQYDILAAELRKHLDMKKIYDILEQDLIRNYIVKIQINYSNPRKISHSDGLD